MPWSSDGPPEAELGGSLEVTESAWADACHSQGGTVIVPHFPQPNGELATLIVTGRADAVELIDPDFGGAVDEYYRYLNCGYRVPLVGGTDKMDNETPVGLYRTYASLDDEFTYDNWCRALRAGRTFVSGGALISLTVEGHRIGDTFSLSGPGTVTVEASAASALPLHALEIVLNGLVVARADDHGSRGTTRMTLLESVNITEDSWIVARCVGPRHHDSWQRPIFAHTSPIYLTCGGDDWKRYDDRVARYLLTLVEGSLSYVDKIPRYHRPGTVTHHHGEDDHRDFYADRSSKRRPLSSTGCAPDPEPDPRRVPIAAARSCPPRVWSRHPRNVRLRGPAVVAPRPGPALRATPRVNASTARPWRERPAPAVWAAWERTGSRSSRCR
ncbi:MAG TPA: CehA/McbA family metallohydrolase [Streptosporangiaceae bacterium]|jgi:hypothetical protein|nr:CehA/McbA family metallohydrolase [Streptosporangiaceae bacterium]